MNDINVIGFAQATLTNDMVNLMSATGHNVTIVSPDNFFNNNYNPDVSFIVAVVRDKELRRECIDKLTKDNLTRATFIHPTAVVDKTAQVDSGCFIGPFSSIFYQAIIKSDCILGPYSMVSHCSTLGKGCILHPGTIIAGSTNVGDYCLTGVRSTVIDKLTICDDVVIGAGSLVSKNITISGTYVGYPARKVK